MEKLMYMLVRSNPDRNNSVEYGVSGFARLSALKSDLWDRYREKTELYVIDVERGTCVNVEVSKADSNAV